MSATLGDDAIWIRGNLRNKGLGPAKDVVLYLNRRLGEKEGAGFQLTSPVLVTGLIGAGETIEIDIFITEHNAMKTWDGTKWNPVQVFRAVGPDANEVILQYDDVFGNPFRTVHPRGIRTDPITNLRDRATLKGMMTRPDRPAPIFLTGLQDVDVHARLPSPPVEVSSEDHGRRLPA